MSWPVTDSFKALVVQSHTPTMKVEILENGLVKASSDIATLTQEIDVISGSISDDRTADIGRRSANFSIFDKTGIFTPLLTSLPIYPLKDRDLRLWRGIGTELIPMATVQLSSLDLNVESGGTTFHVDGKDRSTVLAGSDWRTPFNIAAGTTPRAATLGILAQVDPLHTYALIDAVTAKTLDAMTFIPGETPDPWNAIKRIWESAAMEVFFDQMGQIKTQPYPNPLTAGIAWAFAPGETAVRVDPLTIKVSRESLRNGVIVKGSAPWLLYGVSAEAWDTTVSSPTYYDPANPSGSIIGPHPEYIEDSLVSNATEALALAVAKLPDVLGIEEQISFNTVPLPHLEAGDVVTVAHPVFGAVAPRLILDQLTTPLTFDAGAQTANTRRRTR